MIELAARKDVQEPEPAKYAARARGSRSLVGLLIVAQWPVCAVLVAHPGGSVVNLLNGLCLLLTVAAVSCWLISVRSQVVPWFGVPLASILLTISVLLALRERPVFYALLVSSLPWLLGSYELFKSRSHRACLTAFALAVLIFGVACLEMVVRNPITSAPWEVSQGTYRIETADGSTRVVPGASNHNIKADFDVVYHSDSDGGRVVPNRPSAGPAWLCFGCSFTFGTGLDDADTIPGQLQRLNPRFRVYNYGEPAGSTADTYLALPARLSEHPDAAICAYFFIEDHLRRNACIAEWCRTPMGRRTPKFSVADDGNLVLLGRGGELMSPLEQLHAHWLGVSSLYVALFTERKVPPGSLELSAALLQAMARESSGHRGCKFLLVQLPEREQRWRVETERWERELQHHGVQVLDLESRFTAHVQESKTERTSYFFLDGHPKPHLAALIAEWVSESKSQIPNPKSQIPR